MIIMLSYYLNSKEDIKDNSENFDNEISKFIHVVPDEVIDKLEYPVTINHKIA